MLRLLGACMLAFAGTALGISQARALRRQVTVRLALIAALEVLQGEISHRCTPLPALMEQLSATAPVSVRGLFARVHAGLCHLEDMDFSEIWRMSVSESRELGLSQEETASLQLLGASLGRFDAPQQAAAIERCLAQLTPGLERARAAAQSQGRLYTGLGMALGLMAAVILF